MFKTWLFPFLLIGLVSCQTEKKPAVFQENTLMKFIPDLHTDGCGSGGCTLYSDLTPEQILKNFQKDNQGFKLENIDGRNVIVDENGSGLDISGRDEKDVAVSTYNFPTDDNGKDVSGEYWNNLDVIKKYAREDFIANNFSPDKILEELGAKITPSPVCGEEICIGFTQINPSMIAKRLNEAFKTDLVFDKKGEDYEAVTEYVKVTVSPDPWGWLIRAESKSSNGFFLP